MIEFNYELDFKLVDESLYSEWIERVIEENEFTLGELNYIFCDDAYLLKLNVEFLEHDTLTDIISFDYTMGKLVGGDIFISLERVKENAEKFSHSFEEELKRVMIHGVMHYMGYKDKTEEEKKTMRSVEDNALSLFK
ncbi:rRNA maturation RNase YbeY [Flavicella sp.]|uniref:rRNA maturation RNase YbeY n=1 Tax=Flavicella sp. TaxID=2957742 RepID=UPI002625FD6C|nr:rRNA maturation RNase YbeY [Flavicella sp.]MDG1805346.1 rRNA maturation RNase YbeY [Flavicella sp.]MDG2279239.1 rRNA maturation RNase YbeY [Flavicella sp.]